jgi:hypothetical protein
MHIKYIFIIFIYLFINLYIIFHQQTINKQTINTYYQGSLMRVAAFRDQNPEFNLFSAHILSQADTLPAKGEENSGKIFNDKKR